MDRFDTFGAYMFDLLNAPLKRGKRDANQFNIFFKVMGKELDSAKEALFAAREATSIASAEDIMLSVFGQERDMPRLSEEGTEAYRKRLSMKGIISEWGGTTQGILYALSALGYDQSRIEPLSQQDASRWAEFIVFLRGSEKSGIKDIASIDAEVDKVKQASSKANYGADCGNNISISSVRKSGTSKYPICGTLDCGSWPAPTAVGILAKSQIYTVGAPRAASFAFPETGTIVSSAKIYEHRQCTEYRELDSKIAAQSSRHSGTSQYPLCSDKLHAGGINT